jgi:Tfp pilus assembly protein PilF
MQRSMTIVAVLAAVLVVGGCQNADSNDMRMKYPGMSQLSKGQIGSLPKADMPKILPQTHFAAGMLFEEQGNVGKAITQYRKAVALNHNYVAAYHRLGRMYSLAGKHDAAIQAVARASELKPNNAILHNDLSFEYMFVGRWDDAERSLLRAIELRPTMARAHINLALVQSKQGRFDEALVTFRQVLPEADAFYNLGLLYRGNREYAKAADAFRRVLAINENFAVAQTQLDEVVADMNANALAKVEMVGPVLAETDDRPATPMATSDAAVVERRDRRVETPTPTPTPTLNTTPISTETPAPVMAVTPSSTRKFELRDTETELLAEVVQSIMSGSADVMGENKALTQKTEFAQSTLPAIDDFTDQDDCDREALVDEINAAIDAHVASSKRLASTIVDESAFAIGGDVECDEIEQARPTMATRSLLSDELERLSYNTNEEFVEIEEPKTAPVLVAALERYEDFLTDEEFIEPTPTTPTTPLLQITRHAMSASDPRYEDLFTEDDFGQTEPMVIPSARLSKMNRGPKVAVVETPDPRVEWNQEFVTLDELIDIMDNERRCFEETEFAVVAPEWPIVDSLAYSPVEFDTPQLAPRLDPWADFVRLQAELDKKAEQVTAMVRGVRSDQAETRLATLEKSVNAMAGQVAQRKAVADRMTDARRSHEAKRAEAFKAEMVQKRSERLAMGKAMQKSRTSRTMPATSPEKTRKRSDHANAPMVLAGPHGPPAMADRRDARTERIAPRSPRTKRTQPARRTKVVQRGVVVDWRDGFRSINAMAAIVANDLVCLGEKAKIERDTVVTLMDRRKRDLSNADEEADVSRVIGSSRQK